MNGRTTEDPEIGLFTAITGTKDRSQFLKLFYPFPIIVPLGKGGDIGALLSKRNRILRFHRRGQP
jgi:hypothetical protein